MANADPLAGMSEGEQLQYKINHAGDEVSVRLFCLRLWKLCKFYLCSETLLFTMWARTKLEKKNTVSQFPSDGGGR